MGTRSLALLTLLVPARVDGRTRFDLELSGPPGQRELLGTIGIEDGSLVMQPWRLAMADWSGDVVLERDRIDVKGLRGQFNGGEATIEGRFPVGTGRDGAPVAGGHACAARSSSCREGSAARSTPASSGATPAAAPACRGTRPSPLARIENR